jgi:CRP-like cAMP-binding protein
VDLERSALFIGLSGDVVGKIKRLVRVQSYAQDESLFYEGDPADDLYILRTGRVELTYTLPQDATTEIRITQIDPGENFAWSSLAQGKTLSSHARAMVDSSAHILPVADLHALFLEHPRSGYEVMSRLAQQILTRLRETRKELRWLHQGAR